MTGIPEYGTGRHEDYLSQQDERAEVARDLAAEEVSREFGGWFEAQGYDAADSAYEEMAEAFEAGMQAARDLATPAYRTTAQDVADDIASWGDAAREPQPAPVQTGEPWTEAELSAALDSFYAWFTVAGGGVRVQGQLLGADADEFARSLLVGLESARAHREKGSPSQ